MGSDLFDWRFKMKWTVRLAVMFIHKTLTDIFNMTVQEQQYSKCGILGQIDLISGWNSQNHGRCVVIGDLAIGKCCDF